MMLLGAKSGRITHQFDVLAIQKEAGLSRCVRACISIVTYCHGLLLFVFGFSSIIVFEYFRQTNCVIALRIERPTMLKCNSCHRTSRRNRRASASQYRKCEKLAEHCYKQQNLINYFLNSTWNAYRHVSQSGCLQIFKQIAATGTCQSYLVHMLKLAWSFCNIFIHVWFGQMHLKTQIK